MENVLDIYKKEYDPKNPVVCVDERPCQLIDNVLTPIAAEPGKCRREHHEYVRKGTCSLFIAFCPGSGQRYIEVRKKRTRKDYAQFMYNLSLIYSNAESINVVQDNLNTHSYGSFYVTFDPEKACSLSNLYRFHYTPKKASWLNMAEIELSALSRQCLNRRIADIDTLEKEASIWAKNRNQKCITVNWSFSKEDARVKLSKLYDLVLK